MHAILLAAILATVHGRVVTPDGQPVPGVEVSIGSTKGVTNGEGNYTLKAAPGSYDIGFHLAGFTDAQERMVVGTGDNNAHDQTMRMEAPETIVLAESPCTDAPASAWDWPACSDYNLDDLLETAVKRGDHSAVDLLEQRYDSAFTFREKRTIAGMLLNHVPDDSKYWKPLIALAEDSLRVVGDDEAAQERLKAISAEKGIDPDDYLAATEEALWIVCNDARSRPLLHRALDSNNPDLQSAAIWGFAQLHDESVLELIDTAIAKATKYQNAMAQCLAAYQSDAADTIAFKFLSEDDRTEYLEAKKTLADSAAVER